MIRHNQRNLLLGLGEILERNPEIRIGQLILALCNAAPVEQPSNLYDIEDDDLAAGMYRYLEHLRSQPQPSLADLLPLAKSA